MSINVDAFAGKTVPYRFGLDSADAAASLRKLADEIESGNVLLQGARVFGIAKLDDFAITTLRLSFAEKGACSSRGEVAELYGPTSSLPVAVAKLPSAE